jgi:hypothetical protein
MLNSDLVVPDKAQEQVDEFLRRKKGEKKKEKVLEESAVKTDDSGVCFTDEILTETFKGPTSVFREEVSSKSLKKNYGRGPGKIFKNHDTGREKHGTVKVFNDDEKAEYAKDHSYVPSCDNIIFFSGKDNNPMEEKFMTPEHSRIKEETSAGTFEKKPLITEPLYVQIASVMKKFKGQELTAKTIVPAFKAKFPKSDADMEKLPASFSGVANRLLYYGLTKKIKYEEAKGDHVSNAAIFVISDEVDDWPVEKLKILIKQASTLEAVDREKRLISAGKPPKRKYKKRAGKTLPASKKETKKNEENSQKSDKHISPKILARTALASKTAREIIPVLVPGQTLMIKIESSGEIAINVKYEYEL